MDTGVGEHMASPLELYKEVAEKFKVTPDKQLHDRQKQAFVESQVGEQKAVVNRLIVDTAMARHELADAKDDATKAAYGKKVAQFEDDLRQFTKTLDFFQELAKELGADVNSSPHDDSI